MAKNVALSVGFILLFIGLMGWLTGKGNHTFVLFGINAVHNLFHMATGLILILVALGAEGYAREYCLLMGTVYAMVAAAGLIHIGFLTQILNLNTPDNLFHLGISVACLRVGLKLRRRRHH